MVVSLATLKISNGLALQMKIFVNRKQIIENGKQKEPLFEAPLLSNNSIVSLKSPNTGIYLSEKDIRDLCEDIKSDLSMIIYDVVAPYVAQPDLMKLRTGKSLDFQKTLLEKIKKQASDDNNHFISSNITSITRISKFRYKLEYQGKWKLDIFIDNIARLAAIRQQLLYSQYIPTQGSRKRKLLVMEKYSTFDSHRASQGEPSELSEEGIEETSEDVKPSINFKYRPVRNLGPLFDIHVLERPLRHRS